ncbi:tripartite tricarboxylate transporter substrate binding protein [Allokutzneria sp. NRRL B-24872]|uniref:Bug family tripartite tricarboxylate transporter substrate binding protein n=1 Tax=Allokutzneria sp. NRRL B-24872 TaxID=1137961 RepID=UPI000A391861|nr:tripartite tricarboxylate transporter substrate-binding protein [Allokutzneria sp. NRRL B-24872]
MSRRALLVGALSTVAALVAGCNPSAGGASGAPVTGLRIMAPAKPGGGWHQTAQSLQDVLQRDRLAAAPVQVYNVEGAGGVNGLNQLAGEKDDKVLMVMGQVMVGGIISANAQRTLKDTTPIARLLGESLVLVVPETAPYRNLEQFLSAWRADPKGTVITGGSAGGADQILAGLIADRVGIDPAQLNYVPNSGGGESIPKLLSGEVKAGISGVGEYKDLIKSGKLRAIAVSGQKRSNLIPEVKTLTEQGIALSYLNWRGVVARPGLSDSVKQQYVEMIRKMRDSATWQQVLKSNDWEDSFLTGEEFAKFIEQEDGTVRKALKEIGAVK